MATEHPEAFEAAMSAKTTTRARIARSCVKRVKPRTYSSRIDDTDGLHLERDARNADYPHDAALPLPLIQSLSSENGGTVALLNEKDNT